MISIALSEPECDRWKRWCRKCSSETARHIAECHAGIKPNISKRLYKAQKHFFLDGNGPFHGKCAYCETVITTNQRGDVEHYRPKSQVQHEDGAPVRITKGGETFDHPGYYWLAYHWRNLLPSCISCNQRHADGGYGKGGRFPVDGAHASAPGEEEFETPMLLNPCSDNPAEHIDCNRTCILIGSTARGQCTIGLLGLNQRDLPRARKRKYEAIADRVRVIVIGYKEHGPDGFAQKLHELVAADQDYAAAASAAVRDELQELKAMIEAYET